VIDGQGPVHRLPALEPPGNVVTTLEVSHLKSGIIGGGAIFTKIGDQRRSGCRGRIELLGSQMGRCKGSLS
tara:strand:- start:97763 stop:97975 length:213 start_codon:yes stop_codon:yes gene_type:complete